MQRKTLDVEKKKSLGSKSGCCAPLRFHVQGIEVNEAGLKTEHEIWWDQKNLLSRWDKTNSVYSYSLYNNYSSLNEYVLDAKSGKCDLFGSDAFYGWCYGSRGKMVEVQSFVFFFFVLKIPKKQLVRG